MSRQHGPEYPTILNMAISNANWNLFTLFLVCKLTGQIAWPWLWVLAPIWIPLSFSVLMAGFLIAHRLNKTLPDWRKVAEE